MDPDRNTLEFMKAAKSEGSQGLVGENLKPS